MMKSYHSYLGVPPSVATEKPEVKFELENNTVEKKTTFGFQMRFCTRRW